MTILTTTFNCEKFIEKCLYSIMTQSYTDFKCFITDDMSTDNTVKIIEDIIKNDNRFFLIKNDKKRYQPGNYDYVIRDLNLPDNEICIEVDGDDWLPTPNVFEKISKIYENESIWMTSGSFMYNDGRKGFANPPKIFTNIRNQVFTLSHLRTWKSWLWKKIDVNDLKDENGNYWNVAGDLSFMFPMLEMSGESHFKFIPDILYIYNESNPLNDHKINLPEVTKIVNKIRGKEIYKNIN